MPKPGLLEPYNFLVPEKYPFAILNVGFPY